MRARLMNSLVFEALEYRSPASASSAPDEE